MHFLPFVWQHLEPHPIADTASLEILGGSMKVLASILAATILLFAASLSHAGDVDPSSMPVIFDSEKHTMYFHDKGWFNSTDYPIRFNNGVWQWQTPNGNWHGLYTPFVGLWNDKYQLILNIGGTIVVHSKDNNGNFDIRFFGNEWKWCIDGSCSSLDDVIHGD